MRIHVMLVLLSFLAGNAAAESALKKAGKADPLDKPTLGVLEAAKSKWESLRLEDYAFVISNECLCSDPTHTGPIQVEVRDGKLKRAVYLGQPRDGYVPGQAVRRRTPLRVTIDDLFERIEKQLKTGNAAYVKIKYDDKGGYPLQFEYDHPAQSGEQFKMLLKDLKLLE